MNKLKYTYFISLYIVTILLGIGCDDNKKAEPQLKDSTIESYQTELLNTAFKVSSAIPTYPHIKSRCLEQQNVVEACLELNQAKMAFEFIKQIENWRKQLCCAELALYCAKNDYKESDVQYFLSLASQVPENTEDWRKDQVDAEIAQTNAVIEQANQKLDNFDEELKALEKLVSTENFDTVQSALGTYSELYNRFYSNSERRNLIENKIKSSWDKMPVLIRINFVLDMANSSLDHNEKPEALKLVNESREMMDSETWPPRYGIPLLAKIAKFHALSGDPNTAKSELKEALDIYNNNSNQIVNIDKADVLRPIAEAYITAKDTALSNNIYKQAIEAGIENPNSRPRAEDLSATCCSMALNKFEPGRELFSRIKEVQENLSDPW